MEMSGQLHAPAALFPGKVPRCQFIMGAGCAPEAGRMFRKINKFNVQRINECALIEGVCSHIANDRHVSAVLTAIFSVSQTVAIKHTTNSEIYTGDTTWCSG
jgi:hypothetical protein